MLKIDTGRNIITVGEEHDLYDTMLTATQATWLNGVPSVGTELSAKIRYGQQDTPCVIVDRQHGAFTVMFREPQRAITPGQSIVLYHNDCLTGGGIIESTRSSHGEIKSIIHTANELVHTK